jgi:hypothetical protein
LGEEILSKSEQVNQELNTGEKFIYKTGEKLISSPVRSIGNSFFHILRFLRRNHPIEPHNIPEKPERPTGPFVKAVNGPKCALIIFVPRNFKSRLIDNFTGGYGYSHVAIDTGEIDEPTGKLVMIESTLFDVVHYSFQDTYGDRHFVKIPLDKIGLDCESFCECVKSKLGEKYDYAEVLTWDEIDDPARQVCSDLAAVCLPDWFIEKIDQARKDGALPHNSISASHRRDHRLEMFISPNAFAKFFNAPHGEELVGPGIISEPMVIPPVKRSHRGMIPGLGIPVLGLLGIATWYYFGHAKHRNSF